MSPPRSAPVFRTSMYGAISSLLGDPRPARPPTSPNCDTSALRDRRSNGQLTRSFRRMSSRMIITPKVCDAAGG